MDAGPNRMSRESGIEWLRRAYAEGYALPAFNVSNLECVQAVVAAAEAAQSPTILQISPGVIAYSGYEMISAIAFAAADRSPAPVIVHLDHCRDPELVARAIEDGFGSVMYDGSARSLTENIATTADLARLARRHGASIEGELGEIGGSESTTIQAAQEKLTSPEDARDFVAATGVDVLAPAIGSIHRMPDDAVRLDVSLVRRIAETCGRPLALHGGSGVEQAQLPELVRAGVGKVNISSRVGRAFAAGIRDFWQRQPDEFDLRAYLGAGRDAVRELAAAYIVCCGSAGRAAPAGSADGADSAGAAAPAGSGTDATGPSPWPTDAAEPE
jgi:fructose-bisphosphate aldolase class II